MDIFTYVHSEVINKMEVYFKFTIIYFKYFSYIVTQYPLIIDFYKVIFQVNMASATTTHASKRSKNYWQRYFKPKKIICK